MNVIELEPIVSSWGLLVDSRHKEKWSYDMSHEHNEEHEFNETDCIVEFKTLYIGFLQFIDDFKKRPQFEHKKHEQILCIVLNLAAFVFSIVYLVIIIR